MRGDVSLTERADRGTTGYIPSGPRRPFSTASPVSATVDPVRQVRPMKLTDLEPMLDPRRPLHFAGGRAQRATRTTVPRPSRLSAVRPSSGVPTDLRAVDAAMARLAGRAPVGDLPDAAGVSHSPVADDVRARAAAAIRVFTGAGTGLLAAVWAHEADLLEARLRTDLVHRWRDLVGRRRSAADDGATLADDDLAALQTATVGTQDAYAALVEFDALHRAFAARDVRALSPQVAAGFAERPLTASRLADGLRRRHLWGDGVLWSPIRQSLIAWNTEADGTRLILVTGTDLADWIVGLTGPTPTVLRWSSIFLATDDVEADADWRSVLTELVQLAGLGHIGAAAPGVAVTHGGSAPVPVTRFLLTAAETRTGIAPIDLTTGATPDGTAGIDWQPARYRETWSAAQNRRIRVFGDAAPVGHRPSIGPVLVTVLPH